jgi:hypothetical protein
MMKKEIKLLIKKEKSFSLYVAIFSLAASQARQNFH